MPSNYDPVSRTYSGVWDGTFKQTWTDNAVWMTSDITTADRFGLGTRIKPWRVDKWELYGIFAIPAQAPPSVTRSSEKDSCLAVAAINSAHSQQGASLQWS